MYLKSRTRSTWFHNIIVDFQDRHHFDKRISEAACEILVLLKYLLENSAELYEGIPFPFVLTELVIFLKSGQVGEKTIRQIRRRRFVSRRDRSSTVEARCLFQAPQHPSTRSRKTGSHSFTRQSRPDRHPPNEILLARAYFSACPREPGEQPGICIRTVRRCIGLSAQR